MSEKLRPGQTWARKLAARVLYPGRLHDQYGLLLGLLLGIVAVGVVLHYGDLLPFMSDAAARAPVGLSTRQSLERMLFLLPIVYATIVFGTRTGLAVLAAVGVILLPRALPIFRTTEHAIFEAGGVLVVGGLLILWIHAQRREMDTVQRSEFRTVHLYLQLQESERRFRDLFENAGVALFACSSQGAVVAANRACERLTGRGRADLTGMDVSLLFAPDMWEKQKEIEARLQRGEPVPQPYDVRFIRKDGAERVVSLRTRMESNGNGARGLQYVAIDVTEQKRLQDHLNVFMRKILTAQEDERRRIAQELHDDTTQSLLLIAQRLDGLAARPRGQVPPDLVRDLHDLHGVTIKTLTDLRRLIRDLRPHLLDEFGLVPALEWLTEELSRQGGVEAHVEVCGPLPDFTPEVRLVLFRIAQEALSNVRRHSGANLAAVRLHGYSRSVKMVVSDNGRGFQVPPLLSDLATNGRLGLLGMYERVLFLDGTLEIHSGVGRGTTVTVELPIDPARAVSALSAVEGSGSGAPQGLHSASHPA